MHSHTILAQLASLRLAVVIAISIIVTLQGSAFGQRAKLAPVRVGDHVEYKWFSSWYPAVVEAYHETGHATLRDESSSRGWSKQYPLSDIRFPNDEGHWMYWGDDSGKFRIEARYIRRDETQVTLLKTDGTEVRVPIDRLSKPLQAELSKYARLAKKLHEESPLRLGDEIEVKHHWTWEPGRVLKIVPMGALVAFNDGHRDTELEFKHENMRYPNGEGPWRQWSDSSGKHSILARYLTHDETHVELLKEDKSKVRMERAKLATKIQQELKAATLFTRRPPEVLFAMAGDEGNPTQSWMDFGTDVPEFTSGLVSVGTASPPQFEEGGFEFHIGKASKLSLVEPIGGEHQLLAIGVHEPSSSATMPTTLYWASLRAKKAIAGPNFLPDEIILAYSATQRRLITAEVRGTWSTPVRFCSYSVAPGQKIAKPELKWSVPKASFAAAANETKVAFLDNNRVLIGYGSAVGLWNLAERRMEYVIPSSNNEMNLSPNGKYYGTDQFSHGVLVETDTGNPIAKVSHGGHVSFSRDGKYLITGSHWGLYAKSLLTDDKSIMLASQRFSFDEHSMEISEVSEGWLSNGASLWNLPRRILAWTYVGADDQLSLVYTAALTDKLLAVGVRGTDENTSVLLGVAKIPHAAPVEALETVSDEALYVLRPGAKVQIDSAVQDPRLIDGIHRAMRDAQWDLDQTSDLVISASANLGPAETKTYEFSRFGFGTGNVENQKTVTVSPWIQQVNVKQGERRLWATAMGGIPSMVAVTKDQSLESVVSEASVPRYDLFESFQFPERVIAPKYQGGLGRSLITPNGLVDKTVE